MGQDTKFLLVDDFSTMRRIVKTFLHDLGYPNVQEAENGKTALPMLKDGNFDFLITDWNVPGSGGAGTGQGRASPIQGSPGCRCCC